MYFDEPDTAHVFWEDWMTKLEDLINDIVSMTNCGFAYLLIHLQKTTQWVLSTSVSVASNVNWSVQHLFIYG